MAREVASVISPRLGLRRVLRDWQTIARNLRDPPRRRERQYLS
jgi:hypothetical protein